MTRALKFLLVFAVIAMAASLDLSRWKYRKRLSQAPESNLSVVKLDRDVYLGAKNDFHDLRVIRDGVEVPYEQYTAGQEENHAEASAKFFDVSIVDGGALQFTIDAGRSPHNKLHLSTGERNFRERVRVEASDDNQTWAMLRSDGAIFDFTQDSRQFSSLDVEFPTSTKPFLRVTVAGWNKTSAIQSVSLDYEVKRPAVRETLATITPQISEDAKTQSTVATLDMGVAGLPVDLIVLEVSSPQFHRAVNVEVSLDGKEWGNLVEGVISRLPGDGFTEERLSLVVPETFSRYLRVRIYNRDDQPVVIGRVRLEGLIRYVKFLASAPGNYWLYYGNPEASVPGYDLGILLSRLNHVAETRLALGAAEANPAYHAPAPPQKPWSEQHPAILYTVLGVAVVGLGIATIRFAARLRTSS